MLTSKLTLSLHDALPIFRAERMGWLPSAPQLNKNPLEVAKSAQAAGMDVADYVAEQLKSGELGMACEEDRKSTRLNSSHVAISYAVFCLNNKNKIEFYQH